MPNTTKPVTAAAKTTPTKKKAAPVKRAPAPAAASTGAPLPVPGWYTELGADPGTHRYWDGEGWFGDAIPINDTAPTPAPPPPPPAANPTGRRLPSPAPAEASTITFRGRVMKVRAPTIEQIAVWQRVGEQFQAEQDRQAAPPPPNETPDQAATREEARRHRMARLLNRSMKVIMSVLLDEADRDWVEDQMMEGELMLDQASTIVTLAVDALVERAGAGQPTTTATSGARRRR